MSGCRQSRSLRGMAADATTSRHASNRGGLSFARVDTLSSSGRPLSQQDNLKQAKPRRHPAPNLTAIRSARQGLWRTAASEEAAGRSDAVKPLSQGRGPPCLRILRILENSPACRERDEEE